MRKLPQNQIYPHKCTQNDDTLVNLKFMKPGANVEASAISKSTSTTHNGSFHKNLINGEVKSIDCVFPLMDHILQNINISPILPAICSIWIYLQVLLTSIWPYTEAYGEDNEIIHWLVQILWFLEHDYNYDYLLIEFIVFLVISIICVSYIIVLLWYYKKNHRFLNATLYSAKFYIEIVAPMLVIPMAAFTGASLDFLVESKNPIGWLFLIFGFIFFFVFFFLFIIGYCLSSRSAIISISPVSSFDSFTFLYLLLGNSISIFLHFLFKIFPPYANIVLQLAHALLACFLVFSLFTFSFHLLLTSVINAAILSGCIFSDIFVIIFSEVPEIPKFVPFPMLLIGVLVTGIIFYFAMKNMVKDIKSKLSDEEEMTDDKKVELFTECGLDKSERKAIIYFRIGFENCCDLFLDWSLFRYISSMHTSTSFLCSIIQIVSLFPGEYRKLNSLFMIVTQRNELTFSDRFLIYQVYRVNTLRQSSASSAANEKLTELKTLSSNLERDMRVFWTKLNASVSDYEYLAKQMKKIRALWDKGIFEYPNNAKFSDEYSRFLCECVTDFENAIYHKHRADLIDTGTNFAIDRVFIHMVRAYPQYIKSKKLDLKGQVIFRKSKANGSSSGSSGNRNSISTSTLEIDAEMEDNIGRQLFNQSKMRMALHHAITNKKFTAGRFVPVCIALMIIIYLGSFIGYYIYISDRYVERRSSLNRLHFISYTRFYLALANNALFFKFIDGTGRFENKDDFEVLESEDTNVDDYLSYKGGYSEITKKWMIQSKQFFTQLLSEIVKLSDEGVDVYDVASALLNSVVDSVVCYGKGLPIPPRLSNEKNLVLYSYFLQSQLAARTDLVTWFNTTDYCELALNWNLAMAGATQLFQSLTKYQSEVSTSLKDDLSIIQIAFPIIVFIVAYFPGGIACTMFFKKFNVLTKALLSLEPAVKQEAMKPIMKNIDVDDTEMKGSYQSFSYSILYIGLLGVVNVGSALLLFAMVRISYESNENITQLNFWQYFSASRTSTAAEAFYIVINVPIYNSSLEIYYTDTTRLTGLSQQYLKELQTMNSLLLQGSEFGGLQSKPCYGYDETLDNLNMKSSCTIQKDSTSLHDTYRCSSINQQIATYSDFVKQILQNQNDFGGAISDPTTHNFIHLCDTHLWRKLSKAMDRLVELVDIEVDKMNITEIIILVVGIIVTVFNLVVAISINQSLDDGMKSGLSLIKHIPPLELVNNKKILNIILNRDVTQKEQEMGITQSVINKSLDAIIGTALNGVIEVVNPAVTNTLGYTPEQLLGQQPSALFAAEDAEKIIKQMNLMRNKQSGPVYEDHMTCISDSTENIPCSTKLLAMFDGEDVNSFVLILRDETELLHQQQDAEKAKAQSENLLFHILPRDIVIRLNRGEKDITFTVPSASIIFIDIQRFSEYTANLTPQEIMGNLSLIFASFDNVCKKYPLITKIKLIGDVYMAAAGLFTPDDPPKSHAEQIVRFGLDCLGELEDVNVKLNANLTARVGINTGGPILAGVLGTDKPVFDIIGDPINIASRLQSTDIAGRIQIPQSTYDLISGLDFTIEQRGEVYLKGKGQTMAYYVMSSSPFVAAASSLELLPLAKQASRDL